MPFQETCRMERRVQMLLDWEVAGFAMHSKAVSQCGRGLYAGNCAQGTTTSVILADADKSAGENGFLFADAAPRPRT